MSYHNLLFMDFKVPLIWPLPPSSNSSLALPIRHTLLAPATPHFLLVPTHKRAPASGPPHFLLPLTKLWCSFPPPLSSDLYPNTLGMSLKHLKHLSQHYLYPLTRRLQSPGITYPLPHVFNRLELYFIPIHLFIVSPIRCQLKCKLSKGSGLNHVVHFSIPSA